MMNREAFLQLSPIEQEDFINGGGSISPDSSTVSTPQERVMISPLPVGGCSPNSVEQMGDGKVDVERMALGVPPQTPPSSLSAQVVAEQYADGFDIQDPVELLYLLDDDIASGTVKLHKWQVQFMIDFASNRHVKDQPFQATVRACNGSGKDKYVVSACAVWLCMKYRLARGVVTNGSGVQLDNQTETYIRFLCQKANRKWADGREEVWKCNYRYYECLPTQSPITLFATDEANKAEGYHPIVANAKMAIFASEAKAIPDEIFTALGRCNGFTHRVDVSTPGLPMGYFFDTDTTAIDRKELKDVKDCSHTQYIRYHITAYDCPHITPNEIEIFAANLPGGKNSTVFKSGMLAEFGTTDEMVVIPYTYIYKAFKTPPKHIPEPYNKAGLDLSDGGAETVLLVRNGNKMLKVIPFRFDNTEDTLDFLEQQFKENDLNHPESFIFADCCGIGKPMINSLKRRGWSNMRFIDSRTSAIQPRVYLNRGTELFFHARLLLERHELIVLEDKVLVKQLSTRYYKITGRNIHQLLTKLEQKSRGYPSPDRADAFNLAFWDYKSTYVERVPNNDSDRPFKLTENGNKPVGTYVHKVSVKGSDGPQSMLGRNRPDTSRLRGLVDEYNRAIKAKQQEEQLVTKE